MPSRLRATAVPTFTLSVRTELVAGRTVLPFLKRHLRAAHAMLKPPLAELSVAIVGDKRMGELHDRFMGIAGPTDVLTFPLEGDARGRVTGGEVVVCLPEARRRAREHRTPLEHELLLYALHGLLHLCGYDDRTQRAYATMHRTEDEILNRLGIGPVFAAAAPGSPTNQPKQLHPARGRRMAGRPR